MPHVGNVDTRFTIFNKVDGFPASRLSLYNPAYEVEDSGSILQRNGNPPRTVPTISPRNILLEKSSKINSGGL